ncbi:MAG: hypothetical protein H0V40_04940, partial [Actinobacteria bacterium]|nr:hypothetical protein [Actinomycetota bacterium]
MSDVIALIERIEADLARLRRLVAEEPALRYTGCRRTRGTHGSGHVHDPLGTDVPPADWPHPR